MSSVIPQTDVRQLPNPLPPDLVVLDVREKDEWDAGHVEHSLHIPLMQLPGRMSELPAGREVLVVCKVGARSAQATAFLRAQGIHASNLAQGLIAWEYVGRPLTSDAGIPAYIG
jgi:rhodanese-related sulfurtransferase